MFEAIMACSAERESQDDPVVLWVFRNSRDQWCVRKEGGEIEASFPSRKDAVGFARKTARTWGYYSLFIALPDGRIARELCSLGSRPAT
ncbi:MAG TPA: hypothetical protein VGO34_07325 [Alphaproteobacteria bacterium]